MNNLNKRNNKIFLINLELDFEVGVLAERTEYLSSPIFSISTEIKKIFGKLVPNLCHFVRQSCIFLNRVNKSGDLLFLFPIKWCLLSIVVILWLDQMRFYCIISFNTYLKVVLIVKCHHWT